MKISHKEALTISAVVIFGLILTVTAICLLDQQKPLPKATEQKIEFLLYDGYYDGIGDLVLVDNSPVYSAKIGAKWFIIQNKKRSNESYDEIVALTGAGTEFGFVGKQNGKWYVIYKGRKIGGPYDERGPSESMNYGESSAQILGFTGSDFIYVESSVPKLSKPNSNKSSDPQQQKSFVFNNGTKIPYSYEKEMEFRKTISEEYPTVNFYRIQRNLTSWDESYSSSVNGKNLLLINDFGYRLQYDNKFVSVPDERAKYTSIFKFREMLLNEINGKLIFVTDVSNLYVQESDADYLKKSRWGVFIEP